MGVGNSVGQVGAFFGGGGTFEGNDVITLKPNGLRQIDFEL